MSDTFEADLELIRREMDHVPSADEQIERRCDFIIRELDELCRLATNAETIDLVEKQKIGIGQILTRAQLVASFIMAREPGKLRIVRNG